MSVVYALKYKTFMKRSSDEYPDVIISAIYRGITGDYIGAA
jgi:hypothetical protein